MRILPGTWRWIFSKKDKKPRKSHPYDVMSPDHRCVRCGKPLKLRLVLQRRKNKPKLCFAHWTEERKGAAAKPPKGRT